MRHRLAAGIQGVLALRCWLGQLIIISANTILIMGQLGLSRTAVRFITTPARPVRAVLLARLAGRLLAMALVVRLAA
ncbi:hypothetical protein ABQG29_20635, partial [Xanthomonas nasturtii]|uniref:hypothetical protein n=1 Tax=Xanthomonas nasturtii TaxID=1843581 RepID=UPI0032E4C936